MEKLRTVILYGSSLSILGIEASLKESPGLEVIRMDDLPTGAVEFLEGLSPDVIAYDSTGGQPDFIVPLLQRQPDVMLIGLNLTTDKALVLTSKEQAIVTTDDLVQVIGKRVDPSVEATDEGTLPIP